MMEYLFTSWITGLVICFVLLDDVITAPDSSTGGFTLTSQASSNLLQLQCTGTQLSPEVRRIMAVSVGRRPMSSTQLLQPIASLSQFDGVRLENLESTEHIYASGTFQPDDMAATTLTILIPLVAMETDVTYECDIAVMVRGGKIKSVVREINVTLADLQIFQPVTITTTPLAVATSSFDDEHQDAEIDSSSADAASDSKPWSIPMVILMVMATLILVLFIVCLVLAVDRCRDKAKKRKTELPPHPLFAPPATLPRTGTLMKHGHGNYYDDSGVSTHYAGSTQYECLPFDERGEITQDISKINTFIRNQADNSLRSSHMGTLKFM